MDLGMRDCLFLGVRDQGDAFVGGFDKVIGTKAFRDVKSDMKRGNTVEDGQRKKCNKQKCHPTASFFFTQNMCVINGAKKSR